MDGRVKGVISANALFSYRQIVESGNYEVHVNLFLPKVLNYFDLPDLAAALAPRLFLLLNPRDPMKNVLGAEIVRQGVQLATQCYRLSGPSDQFSVQTGQDRPSQQTHVLETLRTWKSR